MRTQKPLIWILSLCFLFLVVPSIAANPDNDCSECHGDSAMTMETEEGVEISIFVDEERFSESVHGAFECLDCHTDIDVEMHPGEKSKPVDCALCHEDASGTWLFV